MKTSLPAALRGSPLNWSRLQLAGASKDESDAFCFLPGTASLALTLAINTVTSAWRSLSSPLGFLSHFWTPSPCLPSTLPAQALGSVTRAMNFSKGMVHKYQAALSDASRARLPRTAPSSSRINFQSFLDLLLGGLPALADIEHCQSPRKAATVQPRHQIRGELSQSASSSAGVHAGGVERQARARRRQGTLFWLVRLLQMFAKANSKELLFVLRFVGKDAGAFLVGAGRQFGLSNVFVLRYEFLALGLLHLLALVGFLGGVPSHAEKKETRRTLQLTQLLSRRHTQKGLYNHCSATAGQA